MWMDVDTHASKQGLIQSSTKIDKDTKATKKQTETKRPELHHAQQIVSARLAPGAEIVMVVTCTFL